MGCGSSRHYSSPDGPRGASGSEGGAIRALTPQHHLVNVVTDRDIHETYDFCGPVLGKGSFATVLRVRDRLSGSEYAVKQIDLDAIKDSPSSLRMVERECRTMMSLAHPNIVRLQEVYRPQSGDRLYMVLDRLEGGSVDGLWRKQGKLSEDHAAHIILQVVSAVRYCHDRGIAHRDLKMENSLYEDSSLVPIVKVIDFGLCAEINGGETSRAFVGTVLYTAPEVLKVDGHGLACDVWSIGVMAYALVSGEFPWYSDSRDVCGQMIKYTPLRFPEEKWAGVPPLCRDFIERCLVKKPKKRITAAQAQRHPWLQKAARAMERGAPLSKESMMAMLDYQNGNTFKKIVMELVAYSYEPAQIKDLELDFLRMDTRGNGEIRLEEFKNGLLERWAVMDDDSSRTDGDSSSVSTMASSSKTTRSGSPRRTDKTEESERCSHRHTTRRHQSPRVGRPHGSDALALSNSGRNSGKLRVTGGKRLAQTSDTLKRGGSGGGPRVTGEHKDGRPKLGVASGDPHCGSDGDQGGVDADALNAALLAVQADATVSRPALHRMLSARQRRPLRQDSNPSCVEGDGAKVLVDSSRTLLDNGSGRGVKGLIVPKAQDRHRHRKSRKMDDRWAEEIFRSMDHDHSGSITFTDFVAGCLVEKQVGETALRTAFDRLDHSRSGLISLEDVQLYLGEDFNEEEMARNIRAISSRQDGQVSYNDFKRCLLGGALPNSRVVTPALSRSNSFKALSKLASASDLTKTDKDGGEEIDSKDLEQEEIAVLQAATTTMSEMQIIG
eukprot:g1724.t1